MTEDNSATQDNNAMPAGNQESRPVDLGLSEGKSMGFAPTGAIGPDAFPIGGAQPIQAAPTAPQAGTGPQAVAGDSGGTAPQGGTPSSSAGREGDS